ncbi:hypothetical protein C2E23DRAFT_548924 [Lenzites betulinus]|nr:hypothetical protein C2E23DRAFT_548924 [Lenzites betulinus]
MFDADPPRKPPPMSSGRRVANAIPALFDATLLKDELTIGAAISAFESHLVDPAIVVEEVVEELLSVAHCWEFVMSAVSQPTQELICNAILQKHPNTPGEFLTSQAAKLLSRLSLFFLFLPYGEASDEPLYVRVYRRDVETAVPVLQALTKLRFGGNSPVEDTQDNDLNEFTGSFFAVKTKHKRKQSKRSNRAPTVDTKAFADYRAPVPKTVEAAAQLCENIIGDQMRMLKDYLELFRVPHLVPFIRGMYIPRASSEQADEGAVALAEGASTFAETTESETPAAFPLVRPMKAALYFDSADGFGEWRVLISTRADRDLRQARNKSPGVFKIYIKKIKELSRGQFSDDNQKRLTGLNVEIPIYEAKMTGDTRLVYQVDCIPEFESDVERQVLKIFGIYTHAQLDRRFWDCMSRQLERKGIEYKKRCTFRNPPLVPGDYVVLPASWPPPAELEILQPASALADLRKEDMEELHSLLVLEKFVTFSQALLNSILADQDVAHVFDVSPHEKKIIEHTSSCYVLGRSGTGKTTTMLFKMLGIERSWESCRETMPKPRQLFVTQSRVLAEKVEEYFVKLLESLATASQSPAELAKIAARKKSEQQQGLVDRDEETFWRGDLPKRFGALKQDHFPMFLTYDHICRLLEAEFHYTDYEKRKTAAAAKAMDDVLELRDPDASNGTMSNDYMQQRRASFVSYGTFLEEYWAHFPQTLTKGLDPTLVFGEFMGVIKGSEQSLDCPKGYLDKTMYHELSHRTQATFANQRENIYKLFQAYLKRKKERGDYDAADRTHALINCLKTMGVPGEAVDFMYVDEAQDNLLIDAVVLRTLCHNPHGMFWAGDTAQTISVGSAFRFNDLKAFLYRFEEATADSDANRRTQPESFHLAVNYRSHAGIVDCAYSVIELITDFWPHAIDALGQETGMVGGLKPVFFNGWDQNTVRYEQFLFGESGSHIEFGAQQCILVRDDAAREKLRAQVGDIGLILTLYESKGLEFNDVLLFNFFEDSTVDLSQWRVVLNALAPEKRANHPAPRFDDARHSGVCRELKFLYVAITRARKNLWIADCSEKGEPMRILWTEKDLIENCDPGTDVPRLAMSSTAEDWAKMALELFNNRRYMQAMHCYERAGLAREKAAAHAYYLREVARSTVVTKGAPAARAMAYVTAAEAFSASAQEAVTEKRAYYRIAAECYINSGDDYKGAQAYVNATEYTLAAAHFRKAGKFDDAVGIVKNHREDVAENVAENIVEVSRLYYLREKNLKNARGLFDADDELLEYMDDFGFDIARASFLEQLGRFGDAASVHLSEGNTLEAIRLLTMDRDNSESVRKAMQCLLDGLWYHLPCGTIVNDELLESDATLTRLLQLSENLVQLKGDGDLQDEVSMFRAIARRDLTLLESLGIKFSTGGNVAAAFLCFDHVFSAPFKLQTASLVEVADKLCLFYAYACNLQRFCADSTIWGNSAVLKMFAIQESADETFLLPKDCYLATLTTPRLAPSAQVVELGIVLPRWELEKVLKCALTDMLLRRIKNENSAIRSLRRIQPCLPYAVYHHCNRVECPRYHEDFDSYDSTAFNARIRVVMQQILVYQLVRGVEHPREQLVQKRFWLEQLYDALFPTYYKLGSFYLVDPSMIPELERGRRIAEAWLRDLLYNLTPYGHPKDEPLFLTTLMKMINLSVTLDSKVASEFLPRINAVAAYRPPPLLRPPEKAYIVHDLLGMLQNSEPSSLNRGILFVNHVLEGKIPVDVGVLCSVMEYLCGAFLISMRLQKRETLHNLTLPKSWLVRLIPRGESLRARETQLSRMFKKNMGDLLEQVYTGAPWLLFDGRDLQTLFPARTFFFARFCAMFCLWGYNISSWPLRNDIHRSISLVRKQGRSFHPLIEKYVNARSWDALSRLVRGVVSGSALDEMIQLHHGAAGPVPNFQPPPNVRRVVYNRTEDIPFLLKTGGSSVPLASLRPDAAPFVPSHANAEPVQGTDVDDADNVAEERQLEDVAEDDVEQPVDMAHIAHAIDAQQAKSAPATATAEEIAAAQKIAAAYQQYQLRVHLRKPTAKEERRRRVYDTFAQTAESMEWPHAYYRLLFRGPIPHLYIATNVAKGYLHDAKDNAKKRLQFVTHLELDAMQTVLTQTIQLIKEVERLYRVLGPSSDMHRARDLAALEECTVQVEAFIRSLPSSVWDKCEHDMKIALKGIVQKKKPPKDAPKPALNVEDGAGEMDDVDLYMDNLILVDSD